MTMKSRKPNRTGMVKSFNPTDTNGHRNPPGLRIHYIIRAYKRGIDSGHGDLRWFGADETTFSSRTSKHLKPPIGVIAEF